MASDTYKQFAILYVDDEEQALKYFKKGLEKDFQILTAPNAEQAMAILGREAERIAVVISDHRMPGRTGVEFLTELKHKWPSIVRILITAYAGIDNAIAAINSGAIYRYITKPANLKELQRRSTAPWSISCSTRSATCSCASAWPSSSGWS